MATVARVRNIRLAVYGNDHLPNHFHAEAPNWRAQIDFATMQVMNGSIDRKDVALVMSTAAQVRPLLVAEWNRLNPQYPTT